VKTWLRDCKNTEAVFRSGNLTNTCKKVKL